MGGAQSISTEVEIQASPATVRSVLKDFASYKQWSSWTIEPIDSSAGKTSSELKPEENRLKVDMKGTVFRPLVKENSTECFAWEGSLYGLLVGRHEFVWSSSNKTQGGTTMAQKEDFHGVLAFMFAPGWSPRKSTLEGWNAFFRDLKKEAEKRSLEG